MTFPARYWLPVAVGLTAIAGQLLVVAAQGGAVEGCPSGDVSASAPPPDFLFATAEEWRRFALEAELDKRR